MFSILVIKLSSIFYNIYNYTFSIIRVINNSQNSKNTHVPQNYLYPLNYLPWNSSDQDHPPLCTSSGLILQLCKVSSVSVHLLLRGCAYRQTDRQTYRHMEGHSDSYTPLKLNSRLWEVICIFALKQCFMVVFYTFYSINVE